MSIFMELRKTYQPHFPRILQDYNRVLAENVGIPAYAADNEAQLHELERQFPNSHGQPIVRLIKAKDTLPQSTPQRIGVVLSGGQAPGGHNVITGIFDGLKSVHADSVLIGFQGGPSGIINKKYIEIDRTIIDDYRNSGGFDMLGSGRGKIESEEQFSQCDTVLRELALTGLIIIGGDDSNTNAAFLAEYLIKKGNPTRVIGVPKTIDGDLKNNYVETSFGFDTAVRIYSELIANVARDAISAKKYYHFIRLMGRSASHITLEAALQTHPNITLISEEAAQQHKTLQDIVSDIADIIKLRAEDGKNYGIVLVPEGLIEFVPEIKSLIKNLNQAIAASSGLFENLEDFDDKHEFVRAHLNSENLTTYLTLPEGIQRQLLYDRDPHGNVAISRIETEKLIISMLIPHLEEEKKQHRFKGKFNYQSHFFGYEGRCGAPTNFDADYAYALGRTATMLVKLNKTGYMAVVRNLALPEEQREALGIPLTSMMNLEERQGAFKPVIKKALVDLSGRPFLSLLQHRKEWAKYDRYQFVGPIQYFGPDEVTTKVPVSLSLEYHI